MNDTSPTRMVYHSGLFPRALVWALVGLATASQVNGAKADPSVAAAVAAPKSLGDLTGPWILFVDDSPVARRSQVVRRYHAFNKHPANPVLKADQPWEQSVYLYGTVLPGEQRKGYRVWYHGTGRAMSNRGYFSAYAESNDGVHWTKPPLGIVPWQGNTNNNMILDRRRSPGDDHHPQVIHTPWDPDPARRYRMLTFAYSDGYWASYSPDGIHWDDAAHNPVLVDPGDVGNFNWDPHRQAYIGCTKLWLQVRGVNRRCVQFTQTRDFGSWPGAQLILTPDEADDRLRGGKPDFYGLSAFPYESMYIGFLWVYNANGGDDTINVELVSSHDGAHWLRQEEPRPPILPLGSPGQWDDGMVFTPNHPVVDGDTIKLFYGGFDGPHENPGARGAIGLATLRKDGFASLDAGEDPGLVTTRDLIRAVGPLRINARATGGWLKAELLDERGEVIAGYSRDDCEAFTGDNVAHTLRWAEKTGLPAAGRLRVRFVMRHASLFSFTAGAESRLAEDVLDIGSRLEPMVDDHLMDRLTGVEHRLHPPRPAPCSETVPGGYYATVIKDGEVYRYYYRDYVPGYSGPTHDGNPGEITCYAESRDGIVWVKPALGLFEINSSRENNAILAGAAPFSHNFTPFLDPRPGVAPEQRYKALAGVHASGLHAFISGDGIRWKQLRGELVIQSTPFAFDSQNVAFWSECEQRYVCYFRSWETPHGKLRSISRTTSTNFLDWTPAAPMNPNAPDEHLYTSGTHPYFRAPHIYLALPTRFMPDRGESTDILFMTSRGGNHYDRVFREAFIRPGPDPDRWGNRANYATVNIVPTGPAEMSLYTLSGRYVLRTDGFASVHADHRMGEMRTRPLRFSGERLLLNMATSAAGSIRVEIQDERGAPLAGFRLDDAKALVGDQVGLVASWKGGDSVAGLAGQVVRLRFVMQEADLFAIQFR